MSNRRTFVAATTGGALLGPLLTAPAAARATVARRLGGSPTQAVFQALAGQDLQLRTQRGERRTLRLLAVRDRAGDPGLEQFSLLLRGDAQAALRSGLYRVDHADSGRFVMRLEADGHDVLGALYRAEFSLLV
ncbi:MAG: hypothetical protein C0505_00595 [Leptothrix sp. (in: Bacteria)]|nr:hypothetical protein [Leptothrix sp. (in: b-proteobacteria)]